jgi:hypothetical protein
MPREWLVQHDEVLVGVILLRVYAAFVWQKRMAQSNTDLRLDAKSEFLKREWSKGDADRLWR